MKKLTLTSMMAALPILANAQGYRSEEDTIIMNLLFTLLILGITLLCRGIICWYWKINKRVSNQERIIELLESIDKKLGKPEDNKEE